MNDTLNPYTALIGVELGRFASVTNYMRSTDEFKQWLRDCGLTTMYIMPGELSYDAVKNAWLEKL